MKKLVIIGANEFQNPLILKAREMGYETHVFAWRDGAVGEKNADYFYPISITEVDEILEICKKIKPSGVASIGSDLANITVAKLAAALGLPGNSLSCIEKSTNKAAMRKALAAAGLWVPFFQKIDSGEFPGKEKLQYPVIVKPTDRSGSRAITRVESAGELDDAIARAIGQSFEKQAIVESYIAGSEYSMESISYEGTHTCLAITKKFTTGSPDYIETGHMQPANLSEKVKETCIQQIFAALDALEIRNGASHAEFRIDEAGTPRIIEIGSRMGGDCIGSDLVPLSTGHDFVKMVIQTAVGEKPELAGHPLNKISAIRFLFNSYDRKRMEYIREKYPHAIRQVQIETCEDGQPVVDSGSRHGFYILQADSRQEMEQMYYDYPEARPMPIWETPIQPIYGWEDSENQIYMKREDLLGFSFGGNKVRFAEAYLQDMHGKHCDSMIIYGNYHSNLCRILSAACRREGLPCYMIYNQDDIAEEKPSGNGSLIEQMGVVPIPCGKSTIAQTVKSVMDRLYEQGRRPYYIYGNIYGQGNEEVPMGAYAAVYEEICRQQKALGLSFDYVFLAGSTNTTQAGLVAGKLQRWVQSMGQQAEGPAIIGVSVNRGKTRGEEVLISDIKKYADRNKLTLPDQWEQEIYFADEWLSGGYGQTCEGIHEVIRKMYRENGIGLDPTYSGKAFWGMMEFLKKEKIRGKNILFLHTGGTPLFFDYLQEQNDCQWK